MQFSKIALLWKLSYYFNLTQQTIAADFPPQHCCNFFPSAQIKLSKKTEWRHMINPAIICILHLWIDKLYVWRNFSPSHSLRSLLTTLKRLLSLVTSNVLVIPPAWFLIKQWAVIGRKIEPDRRSKTTSCLLIVKLTCSWISVCNNNNICCQVRSFYRINLGKKNNKA